MATPADVRRLHRLLDTLTPKVRREVQRALDKLQRRISLDVILDALERGDTFTLTLRIGSLANDLEAATQVLQRAFALGRTAAASTLPALAQAAFRQTNIFAVRAAQASAAQFVTGVTRQTQQAIRTVITEAFKEGLAPRQAARLIRPVIGLTERQALAVVHRRADDLKRGLKSELVQKRAEAYAQKLLRQRALMIARTETIKSSVDGQLSIWREAVSRGFLRPDAEKVWIVTDDDRLCPRCLSMEDQSVPINAMFVEPGTGVAVDGPVLHPQCRCSVRLADAAVMRKAA
jgi:hypothetical protein